MENSGETISFDMNSLRNNLPKKRGLSRYYSGKARSFNCMEDVRCLEDLKKKKKPTIDAAKKRKKETINNNNLNLHLNNPYPCRRISSTTQFSAPTFVGFVVDN
ncbi:hypothetical protein M5689_021829 [Euphorbia peplus]|nr:hypothetical protein M5689_021829 [Euphorbia peplus]